MIALPPMPEPQDSVYINISPRTGEVETIILRNHHHYLEPLPTPFYPRRNGKRAQRLRDKPWGRP